MALAAVTVNSHKYDCLVVKELSDASNDSAVIQVTVYGV